MAQEAGKGRSWLLLLAAGANLVFQFGFFIAVFSVYRKPPEAVMQVGTLAMVLFAVFAAVVCGSTARAYNRSRFGWGFGAFFLPYIIPFVLYGVVRAERKARDRLLARSSAEAPPKATALAHAPIPQQPLAGAVAETGMEATAEEPAPTPTAWPRPTGPRSSACRRCPTPRRWTARSGSGTSPARPTIG